MDVLYSPQSLLPNRATLLTLVRDSPCAIIETDHEGLVQLWNHQAEHLFGYPAAETLGHPLPLTLSERRRHGSSPESLPLSHPTEKQFETQLLDREGNAIDVSIWHDQLYDSENQPSGSVAFITDIRERKRLERALLTTVESESRRLGRELHDSLSQQLLGAAFAVKALANSLQREGSQHTARLEELADLINDAVREARSVAQGLNPLEMDATGLASALQQLADRLSLRTPCTFSCPRPVLISDDTTALHVYRIAQDFTADAINQHHATQIAIHLDESGDRVTLRITCDLPDPAPIPEAEPDATSLDPQSAIRYRVSAIHGSLDLTPPQNHCGRHLTLQFSKI